MRMPRLLTEDGQVTRLLAAPPTPARTITRRRAHAAITSSSHIPSSQRLKFLKNGVVKKCDFLPHIQMEEGSDITVAGPSYSTRILVHKGDTVCYDLSSGQNKRTRGHLESCRAAKNQAPLRCLLCIRAKPTHPRRRGVPEFRVMNHSRHSRFSSDARTLVSPRRGRVVCLSIFKLRD